MESHWGPHSKSWGQWPAEVGDPPAEWLGEWPVVHDAEIPWTLGPIAVDNDETGNESSHSVPSSGHTRAHHSLGLKESWRPGWKSGVSVSTGKRPFWARSYWEGWCGAEGLLTSEPKLTDPTKLQDAIHGLSVGKAWDIPNRAMKHILQWVTSILVKIFNAVLHTQHFPLIWKHARVISIIKPGKDMALPHPIVS